MTSQTFGPRKRPVLSLAALSVAVACAGGDDLGRGSAGLDVYEHVLVAVEVGTLPGELEVGADGSASYAVPLSLPPGRLGVEPVLGVVYNSNGGDGILGPGFTLSGLSAISRCPPTINRDGENGGVTLTDSDRLCLDGQRLEPMDSGDDYWSAATYILRDDPLVRVHAETLPSVAGVYRFVLEDGAGKTITYGGGPDSNVTVPTSPPTPASWLVSQVEDMAGNYYTVEYDVSMAGADVPAEIPEHSPRRIRYTGFRSAGHKAEPTSEIRFSYVTRPDARQGYRFGFVTSRTQILAAITTVTDRVPVREYRFEYEEDDRSAVPHLMRMSECVPHPEDEGAWTCKPPTAFTWSAPGDLDTGDPQDPFTTRDIAGWDPEIRIVEDPMAPADAPRWHSSPQTLLALDFDGDGIEDVAYFDDFSLEPPEWAYKYWLGELHVRFGDTDPARALTRDVATGYVQLPKAWLHATDYDSDGDDDIVTLTADQTIGFVSSTPSGHEIVDSGLPIRRSLDEPGSAPVLVEKLQMGDMDGDGYEDLMICGLTAPCTTHELGTCAGRWYFAAANGSGYSGWRDTGISDRCMKSDYARMGDFDGDGRAELFTLPPAGDPGAGAQRIVELAGDGRFRARPTDICLASEYWDCDGLNQVAATADVGDFNGDGIHDLLLARHEERDGVGRYVPHLAYGSGSSSVPFRDFHRAVTGLDYPGTFAGGLATNILTHSDVGTGALLGQYLDPMPLDIDGDGRADVTQMTVAEEDQHITCQSAELGICWVWGWNPGDVVAFSSNGHQLVHGVPVFSWSPYTYQDVPRVDGVRTKLLLVDANGDGARDILQLEEENEDVTPNSSFARIHFNAGGVPRMVTAVTNGMGRTTQVEYQPLTNDDVYEPGDDCRYPVRCVQDTRYVVSAVLRDTGRPKSKEEPDGSFNRTHYVYEDLRHDLWGRESAGFGRRIEVDERTGQETIYEYDNRFFLGALGHVRAWKPRRIVTWNATKVPQGFEGRSSSYHAVVEEFDRETELRNPPFAYTRVVASREWVYEGMLGDVADLRDPAASLAPVSEVHSTYTHDSFGLLESEYHEHADGYRESESRKRPSVWSPTVALRVLRESVGSTGTNGETAGRGVERSYDALGRVVSETASRGDAQAEIVTTVEDRDVFGNPTRVVSAPAIGERRSVDVGYDPSGIFVTKTKNALGHVTSATYHPGLGVAVQTVDANGLVTDSFYDGFGRVREIDRPGNVDTTIDYRAPTSSLRSLEVERRTQGREHIVTTFDRLGRAVEQRHRGFGGRWLERVQVFDSRGLLLGASRPFDPAVTPTPASFTLYDYDFIGRLLKVTRPSGHAEHVWYGPGQLWLRDGRGNVTAKKIGPRGQLLGVVEPPGGGRMEYTHGPYDAIATVTDGAGNVTRIGYDRYGRPISFDDPDRGFTRYELDSFGLIRHELHDDSGNTAKFVYDALGRLVERTDTAGGRSEVTTFTWDTAANGVGLLAAATSPDGVELSYAYDALSRLDYEVTRIDGESYVVDGSYDTYGRHRVINYPGRYSVTYDRDAWGHLERVRGVDGTVLYEVDGMDLDGHIVAERFGNGVGSNRSYEADGHLSVVATWGRVQLPGQTAPSNQMFVKSAFRYDENGDLELHDDGGRGVTSTFEHDALGRLVAELRSDGTTRRWDYDPIGNLTLSPLGVLDYGVRQSDGSVDKPHAVTAAAGESYRYDSLGRLVAGPRWRSIEYTPLDLPRQIEGISGAVSFRYDAVGRRALEAGPDGKTIYVGDVYQLREPAGGDAVEVFLVPAAGRVVAQVQRPLGMGSDASEDVIQYLHTGRLGSVVAVSTSKGEALIQSYDPFGAKRDEGTGVDPGDLGVNAGFTAHEHDDELGLINMRGRVYSPQLGRFLTPDPIIQFADVPQSFNAYSYVRNRPLSATDPTGFQEVGGPVVHIPEPIVILGRVPPSSRLGNPALDDAPGPHAPAAGTGAEQTSGERTDPTGAVTPAAETAPADPSAPTGPASPGELAAAAVNVADGSLDTHDVAGIVVDVAVAASEHRRIVQRRAEIAERRLAREARRPSHGRSAARQARRARRLRQGLEARRSAQVTRNGGRLLRTIVPSWTAPVRGVPLIGGILSGAGMLINIYDDAERLNRREITTGQYALRATFHVIGGVGGVAIPFFDLGADWVRQEIEEELFPQEQ